MAYDDEDSGFITDKLSSPYWSIPYAITSGLLAGMTPGTARVVQGINTGLGIGIGAEQRAAKRRSEQRLSKALGGLADTSVPVTSTKIGMNPETTTFSLPDNSNQRLSTALAGEAPLAPPAPTPTYQATEQKPMFTGPQREYLKAIGQADPGAAIKAIGSTLFKEPSKPTAVRPGGALVDAGGNVLYQAPAAAEKVTWRPYQIDLGDKIETGMVSSTGEKRIDQIVAKGASPIARERVADMEERRRLYGQSIDARREAALLANEARLESIDQRREAARGREQLGAMFTETQRERAMKPEDMRMAEVAVTKSALARGVDKMPRKAQLAALRKIASDYGFELEGEPTLDRAGWIFGQDALRGDFSLRPKPITTRSERNKRPAGATSANDPLGIR